ncbi:DNA methyltransferase [Salimicrobium jeotgali]|uniref:site-specific DNA-methyltransferase (adenine-specific) n=1 Tax=Salimicrobium jeotgali TaxID=1230341 RepID=K2H939_9BACI|nr:DNA adenine methylase [Salimicrobium jeotgali]AKG04190.1 DNA methyltransferase [Salimicrobium jeotgali]EKE32155.1 hypothetical protein MJ3_04264 [Salimicrobium jeotgali]MBM7695766.1 DNA adenine methylase [Salimicrobium jeotgali]
MPFTKSPLRYPGGKNNTCSFIKNLVAQNNITTYVEPFAGGAAVAINLLLNSDVKKIIINDYDRSIYAFWYSVLYRTEQLIHKINNTEIRIEEWYVQKRVQNYKDTADLLDLGFSTLFLNRTNRSGIIKGGVIGGKDQSGNYKMDCRYKKPQIIQKIREIADRRDSIELYNMDGYDFIDKVIKKTRKSFTFFDPPYFEKGPSLYTKFYNEKNHEELAKKIKKDLRNRKWIVTYDNHPKIKQLYSNLEFREYYLNYSAQNRYKGIEYMFFSKNLDYGRPEDYLKVLQ